MSEPIEWKLVRKLGSDVPCEIELWMKGEDVELLVYPSTKQRNEPPPNAQEEKKSAAASVSDR